MHAPTHAPQWRLCILTHTAMATARKKKTDDNAATPDDTSGGAQPAASSLQRPPAEVLYADQLAQLAGSDADPRPPGWALSLKAARSFILGHADLGIAPKIVAPVASIERMLVSLATGRGLMLVGEPGTAKSMLSELLAAAISGDSTLTIQGGASITEDQI